MATDLSKAVVGTPAPLTPDAAGLGENTWGLYRRDTATGGYTLLSQPTDPVPPGLGPNAFGFGAATPDLGHVVFDSNRQLLPAGPPDGTRGLYEWADGQLRVVGVLPSGDPPSAGTFAGARRDSDGQRYPGGNPISEDGSRIYFTVQGGGDAGLYLRENAGETKIVSASEREGDDPDVATGSAVFLSATADGSVAFFGSPNPLTDDATVSGGISCNLSGGNCDLYRWDAEADQGERLTDLTTQDLEGGGVLGDAFGTDDGSHLYFVATGELAEGAAAGEPNLYLWRQGEGVRHVATLDEDDEAVWSTDRSRSTDGQYRDARISEDGQRLLFRSLAQLTGHDNGGHRQIYLYDTAEDETTCVSCSPLSEPSTADATLLFNHPNGFSPLVLPRNLSSDGSRAYFETPERLVPTDTNAGGG